MVSTVQ